MNRTVEIISVCLFFIGAALPRSIDKSVSIYFVEEKVNGIPFTHRSDCIDGVKKEVWTIQGRAVAQEEYEEEILQAELQERRKERALQESRRRSQEEFAIKVQYQASKKLVRLLVPEVEAALKKLTDIRLEPYIHYTSHSFGSRADLDQVKADIAHAYDLLDQETVELADLQELYHTLELYPNRLQILYQDSVQNAIKKCDDTRLLKDLLELVS